MRIDGVSPGQGVNISNIANILSKLNIGDVVRAQVLEVTSGEVFLKLFDGSTIKAATMTSVDAKPGDVVDFSVKSKNDNQIFLETVKPNDVKTTITANFENDIKKQLTALDIKPDTTNIEIAKAAKDNNLPLNKDFVDKVLDTIVKFKDLTPAKAAFFAANDIKLEENNINSLKQLVDGKLKIGVNLDEVLDSLTQIEDKSVINNIEKDLAQYESSKAKTQASPGELSESEVNNLNKTVTDSKSINTANAKDNVQADISKEASQNISKLVEDVVNNIKDGTSKSLVENLKLPQKIMDFIKTQDISDGENMPEKVMDFLSKEVDNFDKLPLTDKNSITSFANELVSKLKAEKVSIEAQNLKNNFDQPASNDNKSKSILHKTFESLYIKINSDTSKDDINVKNLYKDIYSKLEIIKDNISHSAVPNKEQIVAKLDNIENNINFLNEVNNHNTYVQIPLNVWDKNTTGELYVLKRDAKKKKINPDNVTVLISLNTENLGQVDSLIGVNKKNVSVNMRVEDKAIFNVIKENHKELYNRLSTKGYKLVDLKYRLMEEPANILNVNEIAKKEIERNRTSIDLKL